MRRRLSDGRSNRAVSVSSRPSAFTVRAPSKLSWATRATRPRSSCTSWYCSNVRQLPLMSMASKPARATTAITASHGSMTAIITTDPISSSEAPVENGSGLRMNVDWLVSASVTASRSPTVWRRYHDNSRRRMRSINPSRRSAWLAKNR